MPSVSYPATIEIEQPERMANWRPLLQWILVIPHWVVLHTVLNIVASITAIVAWVTVLATAKLPPGIAAFHASYVRYRARTFSYLWCVTDKFPPFDFKGSAEDPGGAGISVSISPNLGDRNRLMILFRFIVPFAWLTLLGMMGVSFPLWVWILQLGLGAILIPGAVFSGAAWVLSAIAAVLGYVAVVFTGRWPDGLFRLAAGWVRVDARLWAYSMLLVDEYPPYSLN